VNRVLCFFLALSYLMPVQTVPAQQRRADDSRVPVRSDSRLWLEGSSNIRDWTCRATTLEATIEVGEHDTPNGGPKSVKGVEVRVPVQMLKCGDRHMEAHMYAALKSSGSQPGFITARVARIPIGDVSGQVVETEATLNIAGVEKTVKVTAIADLLPDGTRRARGTVPILMTDFGISPPHPWGGLLRTADRVLIQFEIFVAPQP
jgi:hypothetical protein